MKNRPPLLILRFFRWYCHPRLKDYIEGDLMEVYNERLLTMGQKKANRQFVVDVLLLFRPGIIRPFSIRNNVTAYSMYKSYLRIGWRNLVKNKAYSIINIGGLALGIAVTLLIALWAYDEVHFNEYHSNHARIGRVLRNGTLNDETFTSTYLPLPLAEELRSKYGSTFKRVSIFWPGDHVLADADKNATFKGEFTEYDGMAMLGLKLVSGSFPSPANPNGILLSVAAARNLYGDASPINKTLRIDTNMEAVVVGVYEDIPDNSDFYGIKFFAPFELLVSVNAWMKTQGFQNNMTSVYVELAEGISFDVASERIKNVILDNVREDVQYVAVNPQLFLHPMDEWHLWSQWKNGKNVGGLIQTVWLFGIVGGFVLLLACINFMNLSTARSERRAREVGIRKSMGSFRAQLMNQFLSESILVVALAFILAVAIVAVSLNAFNELAGKSLVLPWTNVYVWLMALLFILVVGFIAGSYPAFYLSSFNAVRVLKGTMRLGRFAAAPRKLLVVFQFTVSVTLIIGTIVIYQQVEFARNRPVGYQREGLLMVQMISPEFASNLAALRNELLASGAVHSLSESSSPPTDIWNSNGGFDWKGKDPAFMAEFATFSVTADYGKTVGWEFLKGRDFSTELASDSAAFVINEAAADVLGFNDPLGEVVQWNSIFRSNETRFTVIGVIRDMVIKSPYDRAKPAVYFIGSNPYANSWLNIRINPSIASGEAIGRINDVFKRVLPSVPFDYKFVDEEYGAKFANELRIGKLTFLFTFLAIVISCLGLSGLASFVAEQKTKEIGIRKVVGASVFNLWKMLSVDFVLLVFIACILAVPAGYFLVSAWLNKFEYHTEVSWWVYILTISVALIITLATVSYQAIKAAMANPIRSLRSE